MELEEAVQEAVEIVNGGRADKELPPGTPRSCFLCPLALFLSERTGKKVGVGEHFIAVWGGVPGSQRQLEWVPTPTALMVWIKNFDKGARG